MISCRLVGIVGLVLGFLSFVAGGLAQTVIAPTVASISNSQTLTEGPAVTLSVSVNGTSPFTYQWRKDGTAITGATASTLTFSPIRVAHAGTYTVVVTNSAGSVTSGPVVLAVNAATAPTVSGGGSYSFTIGQTLSISAYAGGSSPITYQWNKGGTPITGATNYTYSKTNAQAADAGTYTLTATNIAGAATSSPITVTMTQPTAPTISTLGDTTVDVGDYFSFWPSIGGTEPFTFQWYKDGVPISGAIARYHAQYATAADGGLYTLKVTNSVGTTTSNAAVVTVRAAVAPTIYSVSSPVSVSVGGSFSIYVNVSGTAPFSYQWKKDGQAISGATSSGYSKSNVQASDAGAYVAVVTNTQGSATSSAVTVTVTNAQPPIITYMPGDCAVREGEYLGYLDIGATGTAPLTFQWRKNGTAIAGATSSSLYLHSYAVSSDAGQYSVVVSNGQGSVTSASMKLTILPPAAPTITGQPMGGKLWQGQTLSLSVGASGTSPLSCQWRKDGVAIAGATSGSYNKSNIASSDAGTYSVVVTNTAGSVTSANAVITVVADSAPTILSHPASASLLPGDYSYGLWIGYRSASPATVQWYRNGSAIAGAISSSLYIYNAQPSNAGTYYAVITNSAGSTTSRDGVITIDSNATRPVITYVPGGQAISGGSSVSLSITTSGSGESVQWYKDGNVIPNATDKGYSFASFTPSSAGTYSARVTNAAGTFTSRDIILDLLDAGLAPEIRRDPQSVTAVTGNYVSFYVETQGEMPQTFQWKKDGVTIAGATRYDYSLGSVSATSAGTYAVGVTNRNGSVTSAAATLTVSGTTSAPVTAPVITRGPASQTITVGWSFTVSVGVLDSTGVTYQWYKNGTAVSGGTNSSLYYYNSATTAHAGQYYVVVTNSAGSATSNTAVIATTTAATGPSFSVQPSSATSYYGNAVTFTATASGTGALTYQWKKDGSAISGATTSTLSLPNVQSGDAGTYTVVATDSVGTTSSLPATLTLTGGTAPYIITSPGGATVMAGANVTFTGSAGGTPAPTLQWQRNGTNIPGAISSSLVITSAQASDDATYRLVATNPLGSASAEAKLTLVYAPPTITQQPTSVSVQAGGVATFTVGASGLPSLSYQWRKDGIPISGANSSTFILTNVQSANAGRYSVVVTTTFGSATSAEAVLTVGNPIAVTGPQNQSVPLGGTATFVASVSSIDPLVFKWAKSGNVIAAATGTTLTISNAQLTDAGVYTFGISRPDGTVLYPLTGSGALYATLTVFQPAGPVFTLQPVGSTVSVGGSVTLTVNAQSSVPFTYQWQKNGVPIPDQFTGTLVLQNVRPSDAGDYRAIAMTGTTSSTSATAKVIVVGSIYTGIYFGSTGSGDSWALQVDDEGYGTFLALLSAQGQAIVTSGFRVLENGTFSFGLPTSAAALTEATNSSHPLYTGRVTGSISSGSVSGQMAGLGLQFTGLVKQGTGPVVPYGFFQAVPLASDMGQIYVIAAPDGTVMLVSVDTAGARGGRGTVAPDGGFTVTTPQSTFVGQMSQSTRELHGTCTTTTGGSVSFATPASASGRERLANVATRGFSSSGARMLTAGFVITGSNPKDVLIRAVGPTLSGFGLSGLLPNPRLRLFKDGAAIMDNDDWSLGGFTAEIMATAQRVGAFGLSTGSVDACLLARLTPGAYTAQVSGEGESSGVVLVEVYDASTSATEPQKLVNLSTRGFVDQGSNILIAGIVVNGSAPKKLLIRAVGPALKPFGVGDALPDPKLQLFQGTNVVRENDNWSESADRDAIVVASAAVGAFGLETGGKDAAMLLYLAPGNYTAQVSGVGGSTGVALVEVYEVP